MASAYFSDEFVHGWPQKICGCSQIIESCSFCCGSYAACSSCPYCHGKAYVEEPCIHSRVSTRASLASAPASTPAPPWATVRSRTPPSPPSRSASRYQQPSLDMQGMAFQSSFGGTRLRSSKSGKGSAGSSGVGRETDHHPTSPALSPPSPVSPSSLSTSSSSSSASVSPTKRRSRCSRLKKCSGGRRDGGAGSGGGKDSDSRK